MTVLERVAPAPISSTTVLAGSVADYLQAVQDQPLARVEYMEGTIFMTPAPVPRHQLVERDLFWLLDRFVREQDLGVVLSAPLDVALEPESNIVQPDLIFIARARIIDLVGERRIEGAPDFIAEILSPSTSRIDRQIKLPLYARMGVAEYWIVDADERTLEVYLLDGESYRVAGVYLDEEIVDIGRFAEAAIAVDQIFDSSTL
ncbi:MAG: Uma2 family endonuclease [Caldilineaceae bacterium]|nr:Uma2 family endonuclease [Caldilineaceae bacterium]